MSEFNTMKIKPPKSGGKDGEREDRKGKSQKIITMAISLVIALFLWGYVIGEVNPPKKTTIYDVPVELMNVDSLTEKGLAVQGGGNYTVDVVVKGKRADLNKLKEDEIIATADLVGFGKGKNYVAVNVSLPSSADLVEVKPSKILVIIEDLVEVSMPVEVVFTGKMGNNTEIGGVEIKPAEIEVSGAKSDVAEVERVQVSMDSGLFQSEEGSRAQGTVAALNGAGLKVETVHLSSDTVDVTGFLMQLKEVELIVKTQGSPGDRLGVTIDALKKIKIKGLKDNLKEITSVEAEPIDLSGLSGVNEIPLKLRLPAGIEAAEAFLDLKATVTVEEMHSKVFTFTQENVDFNNLSSGYKAEAEPVSVAVTVTGTREALQDLTGENIVLSADLQGFAAGSGEVKIRVSCNRNVHSIVAEPDTISVTVSEEE